MTEHAAPQSASETQPRSVKLSRYQRGILSALADGFVIKYQRKLVQNTGQIVATVGLKTFNILMFAGYIAMNKTVPQTEITDAGRAALASESEAGEK